MPRTDSQGTPSTRPICLGLLLILASLTCVSGFAQSAPPSIRLLKPEASPLRLANLPPSEKHLLDTMPPNFYHFGVAHRGEALEAQRFTLEFAETTKITKIESTPDFSIEPGASCSAGSSYPAGGTCAFLVRFTPQGPGRRLGKVTITPSEDAKPVVLGLLGFVYLPVVSFTPGVISTVPATVSGGKGVLDAAASLAVDSGDTLYIADTGNNVVREMDSSGALKTISTNASAPYGVAVDSFAEVYFTEPSSNGLFELFDYAPQVIQLNGTNTDSCPYSAPCILASEALDTPGQLSVDGNNNLFFPNALSGAAVSAVQPLPRTFADLDNPFTYQESPIAGAFTVDANDNLYSVWANPSDSNCQIVAQSLYDAANDIATYTNVAGGRTCGFSGDGGRAGNAEFGKSIGQMAFDAAGNFYFSDTANNRVRRIDAATDIITTIAGKGTPGYTGDGGPANQATLAAPSGVSVDSLGNVYVISGSAATGSLQVVRKVGPNGALTFASQTEKTASAAMVVAITNTGNQDLTFTKTLMTGANTADFTIDPVTTTCNFSAGNFLGIGLSCQIGIIFKPAALGARAATLKIFDNTLNDANYVNLKGTSTAAAKVKITAPISNAQIPSGTTATFSVSVTSPAGPAPTGTVTFKVDGKQIGKPVTLSSGDASTQLTGLTAATHALSAAYSGDARYTAPTVSESITITAH